MRISLPLIPLAAAACLGARAFAAGEFVVSGRAGLLDAPGYVAGYDIPHPALRTLWPDGWVCGFSRVGEGQAAWVLNPADGVSRRVGLFTDGGFSPGGPVEILHSAPGGWIAGESRHDLPDGTSYMEPWVADGAAGVTWPAGLLGPDYLSPAGARASRVRGLTSGGFAWGESVAYSGEARNAWLPWVMNGRTGVSARAGIPEGFSKNEYAGQFTESGLLTGHATRIVNGEWAADAAWVAHAATGVTRRLGFFGEGGYRRTDGAEQSQVFKITESGWVGGTSTLFGGEGWEPLGFSAWVADAAGGGVIRRTGLYEGAEYANPATGLRQSFFSKLTESGWMAGTSAIHERGKRNSGWACWAADARTGAARRVGLPPGPETTLSDRGSVTHLTESGWVSGYSPTPGKDYQGEDADMGPASWVAEAATGVSRPVGLRGGTFVSRHGESHSVVNAVTESGWVLGESREYEGDAVWTAAWVAEAATGATRRLGLTGPEYGGRLEAWQFGASVETVTEEGRVYGYTRLAGASGANRGFAAWMTDAATGNAKRLGLTDGEFTPDPLGYRESVILGWTRSGYVHGVTSRAEAPSGYGVPWVADPVTGVSRRMGLVDAPGFNRITHLTEEGVVAGTTARALPSGAGNGQTAWIQDLKTGRRVSFELHVTGPDGHAHSFIKGFTPAGIACGAYWIVENGGLIIHERPFVWEEGMGTLLFDGAPGRGGGAGGWESLTSLDVDPGGLAVGVGRPAGVQGTGVFFGSLHAVAVPGAGARLTDLTRLAAGKYRLDFHTDTPVRVTLQSSPDLTEWRDAKTAKPAHGPSCMEVDTDPAAPNQYWRLKTAPASP